MFLSRINYRKLSTGSNLSLYFHVGTVDHHLNPTMMLTSVEKNFEDLMKEIQAMPLEVVLQISRVRINSIIFLNLQLI